MAEEGFPPEEAAELQALLRGRAEMADVRRAAVYFRLLRYSFNEEAAARSIEHAVAAALADGCLTGDLIGGRTDVKALSTSEMGDEIVKRIR